MSDTNKEPVQSIPFGKQARDKVTGFTGIVTGMSRWMTGCDQYCVVPPVDKAGKIDDSRWFDEGRLDVIGEGVDASSTVGSKPGGPQADAPPAR